MTQRLDIVGLTSTSTYGFTYDKLNRLTLETLPGSRTNAYTYDAASNLKTVTDAGGAVTYSYDNINRQSSIQEPGVASPISFAYTDTGPDADPLTVDGGQRNTISLPNGVVTTNVLDAAGRLLDTASKTSGGTVLQRFSYMYAINGVMGALAAQEKDKDGATTNYGYDTLERVTSAVNSAGDDFAYTYDAASNITTKSVNAGTPAKYAYNAGNQLCWQLTTAGNVPSTCSPPPAGATVYTYDADGNQLTNVGGTQTAAYNRRLQMSTLAGIAYGYAGPGQAQRTSFGSTQVVNNVLGVASHTTAPDAAYLTRGEDGTLFSQRRTPATAPNRRYYYLSDRLGSTRTLLDETGAVGRRYNYEPYGKDLVVQGNWQLSTGFRWLGAEAGVNGLYRFGERWYDPSTQRWTQQDPLRQAGDLRQANRYAYVGGNPVNSVDLSGGASSAAPSPSTSNGSSHRLRARRRPGEPVQAAVGTLVCYTVRSARGHGRRSRRLGATTCTNAASSGSSMTRLSD